MTPEQIIDGNRLIAGFMGGKYEIVAFQNVQPEDWYWTFEDGVHPPAQNFFFTDSALEYRDRWGWLMPVVEKIEQTQGTPVRFEIVRSHVSVLIFKFGGMSIPDPTMSFHLKGESKIEAVFKAAVQFIDWYNTHNKMGINDTTGNK